MSVISTKQSVPLMCAALAIAVPGSLAAQELGPVNGEAQAENQINVYGSLPGDLSELSEGPEIEGMISARSGREMQVTGMDGTSSTVLVADATEIRSSGGFLGLDRDELAMDSLLNGLPVTVETVAWDGGLVASRIKLKDSDLETAQMIRNGTRQQFNEHGEAIVQNAAATEALRGRMGDIDQYNIKGTTNVHFDTNQWSLTPAAESQLCAAAAQAESMDNALLLVVGYTDATGDQEYNQELSERRAGRVVNHLQQQCGWAPWRMLTPTGMSEADPVAPNDTEAGMAQNRRVAVNILVSKAVEDGQVPAYQGG